jgi:uncharacterized protein YjbJ (UPF0337 family)
VNWDIIEGNWKQAKGNVKQQWGKLTNGQLDIVSGKRDQLVGIIQESYGVAKDEAERQVMDWESQNAHLFEEAVRRARPDSADSHH